MRVSVRDVPRPRRSSTFRPCVPINCVELDELKVLCSSGESWFSRSPMFELPVVKNWSCVIDAIGAGESMLGRLMRDPVTTIVASDAPPASAISPELVVAAAAEEAGDGVVPAIGPALALAAAACAASSCVCWAETTPGRPTASSHALPRAVERYRFVLRMTPPL